MLQGGLNRIKKIKTVYQVEKLAAKDEARRNALLVPGTGEGAEGGKGDAKAGVVQPASMLLASGAGSDKKQSRRFGVV